MRALDTEPYTSSPASSSGGSTSPPPTIRCCGFASARVLRPRYSAQPTSAITSSHTASAPQNIAHQMPAMPAAAGPAGSSVDWGPVQPAAASGHSAPAGSRMRDAMVAMVSPPCWPCVRGAGGPGVNPRG